MKATNKFTGALEIIPDCYIQVNKHRIKMRAIPEISDQKSASYNDEPIIGRSFPLKTYSHSENRAISFTVHFYTVSQEDIDRNLKDMRALESAAYPQDGSLFTPPPVCQIKCGSILADKPLCCVLKSYSVKFPPDVVWDKKTLLPYKFDVDTTWDVVYMTSELPGQDKIMQTGTN